MITGKPPAPTAVSSARVTGKKALVNALWFSRLRRLLSYREKRVDVDDHRL